MASSAINVFVREFTPDYLVELIQEKRHDVFNAMCDKFPIEKLDVTDDMKFFRCPKGINPQAFRQNVRYLFALLLKKLSAVYHAAVDMECFVLIPMAQVRGIPFDTSIFVALCKKKETLEFFRRLLDKHGMTSEKKEICDMIEHGHRDMFPMLPRIWIRKDWRGALFQAAFQRNDGDGVRYLLSCGFKAPSEYLAAFAFDIKDVDFMHFLLEEGHIVMTDVPMPYFPLDCSSPYEEKRHAQFVKFIRDWLARHR